MVSKAFSGHVRASTEVRVECNSNQMLSDPIKLRESSIDD